MAEKDEQPTTWNASGNDVSGLMKTGVHWKRVQRSGPPMGLSALILKVPEGFRELSAAACFCVRREQ